MRQAIMKEDIDCRKYTDSKLIASLKACVADERRCLVQALRRVAEVHRRKLYAKRFSSLFVFVRDLGYSENAAGRRIAVALVATRFPIIYRRLSSGSISAGTKG